MPSIFYRPVSVASGLGWSSNPHLAIGEVTASDSDYAFCNQLGTAGSYQVNLNMGGDTIVNADIISVTWRFRICVVNSSGVPQTANSGQIGGITMMGGGMTGATKSPPPSSWTTYSGTLTKAQLNASWPGQDWNNFTVALYSYLQNNTKRTAISWLEYEFNVSTITKTLPLYHLLNMM